MVASLADRYWTPLQLKDALNLDLDEFEIQDRLITLAESNMIASGSSDIDSRGLQDGTLNLILRNRFEKEIEGFEPDLKSEFARQLEDLQTKNCSLRGKLNNLSGKMAEYLLVSELRKQKRIRLPDYFTDMTDDNELTLIDVRERFLFQRPDGKTAELDVLAQATDGRVLLVEVKKQQIKMGINEVEDFQHKADAYAESNPDKAVLKAFLSLGGFTDEEKLFCQEQEISMAETLTFLDESP